MSAQAQCIRDLRRALCLALVRGAEVEILTDAPYPNCLKGTVVNVSCGTVTLLVNQAPAENNHCRLVVVSLCHCVAIMPA